MVCLFRKKALYSYAVMRLCSRMLRGKKGYGGRSIPKTYTITQILHEILHHQLPCYDLRVQPKTNARGNVPSQYYRRLYIYIYIYRGFRISRANAAGLHRTATQRNGEYSGQGTHSPFGEGLLLNVDPFLIHLRVGRARSLASP